VLEEWGGKGLYVNWWETDVYFIPMPWDLKVSNYFLIFINSIHSYIFYMILSRDIGSLD